MKIDILVRYNLNNSMHCMEVWENERWRSSIVHLLYYNQGYQSVHITHTHHIHTHTPPRTHICCTRAHTHPKFETLSNWTTFCLYLIIFLIRICKLYLHMYFLLYLHFYNHVIFFSCKYNYLYIKTINIYDLINYYLIIYDIMIFY